MIKAGQTDLRILYDFSTCRTHFKTYFLHAESITSTPDKPVNGVMLLDLSSNNPHTSFNQIRSTRSKLLATAVHKLYIIGLFILRMLFILYINCPNSTVCTNYN